MLPAHNIASDRNQSNNISANVRATLRNTNLSLGARVILGELQYGAGHKGYVFYGIEKLAENVGLSVSQTKRYLKQLKDGGYIRAETRPCRSNIWFINDTESVSYMNHINYTNVNKNNVYVEPEPIPETLPPPETQRNAISQCDTQKPKQVYDTGLLREILDVTGDRKSIRCWIKVISQLPEQEIHRGISALKIAMSESIIERPGAYLLTVLKQNNPQFLQSPQKKPIQPLTNPIIPKLEQQKIPVSREKALGYIEQILKTLEKR